MFKSQRITFRIVKKIKKDRSGDRLKARRRPSISTTTENGEEVEVLSLSHDEPGSHLSIRQIAPQLNIRKSSVHTIVKKTKINAFERVSTPQMNDVCKKKLSLQLSNPLKRVSVHSLSRLAFHFDISFLKFLQVSKTFSLVS